MHALAPVADLLDAPGNGLDTAFGAVANNLASDLVERPLADLAEPDLREALARAAALAQRCWDGAGTWVNRERARYLSAMAANALGRGTRARRMRARGWPCWTNSTSTDSERVDRAFLELELAAALRLAGGARPRRRAGSRAGARRALR